MEDARPVGADLHASAKLAQFVCMLVDIDIDTAPDQRERRREPADAAADNRDIVRHVIINRRTR